METNLETEAYEGELKELRKIRALVKHTVLAERMGNIYFICGEMGAKDNNNMPDKILVCPAYGVDFFYVYQDTGEVHGPDY